MWTDPNKLTERIIGCSIEVHKVPGFTSQLLTYLRVAGLPPGLLINFNSRIVTEGIRRFVL
jgi:hypothetical protein